MTFLYIYLIISYIWVTIESQLSFNYNFSDGCWTSSDYENERNFHATIWCFAPITVLGFATMRLINLMNLTERGLGFIFNMFWEGIKAIATGRRCE